MKRLDYIRWRLALWLCPALDIARGKRRLQEVARECGASRALSVHIASAYFKQIHHDR